eukprot:6492502-Amphidinium_carterae.2
MEVLNKTFSQCSTVGEYIDMLPKGMHVQARSLVKTVKKRFDELGVAQEQATKYTRLLQNGEIPSSLKSAAGSVQFPSFYVAAAGPVQHPFDEGFVLGPQGYALRERWDSLVRQHQRQQLEFLKLHAIASFDAAKARISREAVQAIADQEVDSYLVGLIGLLPDQELFEKQQQLRRVLYGLIDFLREQHGHAQVIKFQRRTTAEKARRDALASAEAAVDNLPASALMNLMLREHGCTASAGSTRGGLQTVLDSALERHLAALQNAGIDVSGLRAQPHKKGQGKDSKKPGRGRTKSPRPKSPGRSRGPSRSPSKSSATSRKSSLSNKSAARNRSASSEKHVRFAGKGNARNNAGRAQADAGRGKGKGKGKGRKGKS